MLKILALGNSFSEDATYYLHDLLAHYGVDNLVVNLYIPGCPLERHWENIEKKAPEYQFQRNGVKTDRMVSIPEILREQTWDHILTHQASHDSGWLPSYQPFARLLTQYLGREAPGARLWLNQTWAYEPDSTHRNFMRYSRDQQSMYEALTRCYREAARECGLPLIPTGELIQALRQTPWFDRGPGSRNITRDGFHMDYLYGRYAVAAMWARCLTGRPLAGEPFLPRTSYLSDVTAEPEILRAILEEADRIAKTYQL